MMTSENETKVDAIIDLDADQVIEHEDVRRQDAVPLAPKTKRNWAIVVAAILAAALGGGWFYKDVLSTYIPPDHVKAMSEKLVALETKNATMSSQLSAVEKLAAQLASDVDGLEGKEQVLSNLVQTIQKTDVDFAAQLQTAEQALAEAKQSIADISARSMNGSTAVAVDTALQQRVSTLEKDVASLKVKPAEPVDNTAALSQNLSDLKAKVVAGIGYRDEFDRIQRMVPAAEGLDVLARHSNAGLPSAIGLSVELKTLIADLPKPIVPGPVPESEGWWAGIYQSLSDLITIKVEGDVDWPSTAAAAAAFAESGDLPQAIEQLNGIEAAKPVGVQQWIERAQARLSIEKAVSSVEQAVLRVIAAKG